MDAPLPQFADPALQLTPHFSVREFTFSAQAVRHGIDNRLPTGLMRDAVLTAAMMERIREALGTHAGTEVRIDVSSAWRCPPLNRVVGSSSTSDHPKMGAVDWTAPDYGSPLDICQALAPLVSVLGIGQLIHEYGEWVHCSRIPVSQPVNRVITIDRVRGVKRVRPGIHPAGV